MLFALLSVWSADLDGQTIIKPRLFVGYDFYPERYYTPKNNTNENYLGSGFNSKYIFIKSFSPLIGLGIDYALNAKQAILIDGSFTVFRTVYDIEDRSTQFYYPFGRIDLENYAWQLTSTFEHQFYSKFSSKFYWSISAGPFIRFHQIRKNIIQDEIDGLLKSFPLSRNAMNKLIVGIRAQVNFGVRYKGIALESRYIFLSIYGDLNSLGMIENQTNVPSIGMKIGIDIW